MTQQPLFAGLSQLLLVKGHLPSSGLMDHGIRVALHAQASLLNHGAPLFLPFSVQHTEHTGFWCYA